MTWFAFVNFSIAAVLCGVLWFLKRKSEKLSKELAAKKKEYWRLRIEYADRRVALQRERKRLEERKAELENVKKAKMPNK
jgi:hypothetical protein